MDLRHLLTLIGILISYSLSAQNFGEVCYIEKTGNNGGIRVFSVSVPGDKNLDKLSNEADRIVIETLLFKGVANYNGGRPLVSNPEDPFAKSIVNPKNMAYKAYCKITALENKNYKESALFIIEVNHYSLLRTLEMKGSLKEKFKE